MTVPRAALLAVAAVLAAPAAAQAGTVTHTGASNSFQSAAAGGEQVAVGTEGPDGFGDVGGRRGTAVWATRSAATIPVFMKGT